MKLLFTIASAALFVGGTALAQSAPDWDTDASGDLIALGAGHYATACTACHGSPATGSMATTQAMVPEPPPIEEAVSDWQPNELHWIVENGIKMTGMPAWPVKERGDEVWSVVAYLTEVKRQSSLRLPGLQENLWGADPPDVAFCRTCHGAIDRFVPRLDIQKPDYLLKALRDYRSGVRPSGIMRHAASLVPPDALERLANELAQDEAPDADPGEFRPSPEGTALATRGTRDVPACTACHGPGAPVAQPAGPVLSGQDPAFLATQLRLWRDGVRTGSDKMRAAARALTDEQIALLAEWYAAQTPGRSQAE